MLFHLKLFKIAVAARKKYLYWALIPVAAYLLLAAMFPHSYQISQDFTAQDQTQLSPGPNPMDTVSVQSVLDDPESFLTKNQILMDLRERLLTSQDIHRSKWSEWLPSRFAVFIKRTVRQDLSLHSSGDEQITLSYQGQDQELGLALVNFYAQRLVHAGQKSQERFTLKSSQKQDQGQAAQKAGIALQGDLQIDSSRTLLTWDRIVTAFWLLLGLVVLALIVIWIMEQARPKVYTERQAARYLQAPVLGSVPNLERLLQSRR